MALHNDVFRQQIWEFFCNDLDSCLSVSQIRLIFPGNTLFKGGLNFTSALVIFSVIELTSGYYSGREPTPDTVADFLSCYFSKYWLPFSNKKFAKKFFEVFRNGLSHQWSPKASGIAMDFNANWILKIEHTSPENEQIPILNIPGFYNISKRALKDYENQLNIDKKICDNFSKRYNRITSSDYQEMKILKEMFSSVNIER
jgi:hypothetical protein